MERWMIISLIGIGAFVISLFFEDVREFYSESFSYIFGFEWLGDFTDFLGSAFEGLSEFSVMGLSFGLLSVALIFFTRSYMIEPFVQYYEPMGKIFWTIATYLTVFIGGYFLGNAFEKTA